MIFEPIKCKYVHCKLKTWKKDIKTNFHGHIAPYDMYCNATAVLMIDSVYKQGKNYHLSYILKSVNTPTEKTNYAVC